MINKSMAMVHTSKLIGTALVCMGVFGLDVSIIVNIWQIQNKLHTNALQQSVGRGEVRSVRWSSTATLVLTFLPCFFLKATSSSNRISQGTCLGSAVDQPKPIASSLAALPGVMGHLGTFFNIALYYKKYERNYLDKHKIIKTLNNIPACAACWPRNRGGDQLCID